MRVKYTPNPRLYEEYYKQIGHGFPVYIGSMRGSGVGSVLSGLFRAAIPLLKKGGRALLSEGLSSGLQVAQNVIDGQNFKKAVKQQSKKVGKRLLKRTIGHFNPTPRLAAPPGEPVVKRIKKMPRKKSVNRTKDIFG